MAKTFEPQRALHLAGTVSIPTPFPEPGWISVARFRDANGDRTENEAFVRVEHVLSSRVMVARTISLKDVQAVWFADDPANDDPQPAGKQKGRSESGKSNGVESHRCEWIPLDKLIGLLKKTRLGSVFVKEAASVLLEVQTGMTAAESAEYYPPIARRYAQDQRDCHRPTIPAFADETEDCHRPPGDETEP